MPVYQSASCVSPGCWCHDRRPACPPGTTDEQWQVLRPEVMAVMAELVQVSGRPMDHDLRAMLDAVFYVVKNGIEWRALPAGFPPHAAVCKFSGRWSQRGLPEALVHRLRGRLRGHQGQAATPTAVIAGSQIVKAADTVGKGSRGFHGGKKINGRGRHVAVDVEGWLLGIVVTGAQVSDRAGAKVLVMRLLGDFATLQVMQADSGYDGKPLASWIQRFAGSPCRSSSAVTCPASRWSAAAGSWSGPSAGCCGTAAWSATTSAESSITRQWSTGRLP
jgi:transposase